MKVSLPCNQFYLFKVWAEVRHEIIFVLSMVSQNGLLFVIENKVIWECLGGYINGLKWCKLHQSIVCFVFDRVIKTYKALFCFGFIYGNW
jgi:hypothetical protein